MLKISNEQKDALKNILKSEENKNMIEALVSQVLNLEISNIQYEKTQRLNNIVEYQFNLEKMVGTTNNQNKIAIYFRIMKKEQIKEAIFCFWYLLHQEEKEIKKIEESSIINKVSITELGMQRYKNGVLLESKESSNNILEDGAEVYFIDFLKYVENCKNSNEEIGKWMEYIEPNSDDILLIGIKLNKEIKRKNKKII